MKVHLTKRQIAGIKKVWARKHFSYSYHVLVMDGYLFVTDGHRVLAVRILSGAVPENGEYTGTIKDVGDLQPAETKVMPKGELLKGAFSTEDHLMVCETMTSLPIVIPRHAANNIGDSYRSINMGYLIDVGYTHMESFVAYIPNRLGPVIVEGPDDMLWSISPCMSSLSRPVVCKGESLFKESL